MSGLRQEGLERGSLSNLRGRIVVELTLFAELIRASQKLQPSRIGVVKEIFYVFSLTGLAET